MKLGEFLLKRTQTHELCVIRESGWIIATCWIDHEDLFRLPEDLWNRSISCQEWGMLLVVDNFGEKTKIPCHYIDILDKEVAE